jgi:hypothetical protein
VKIATCNVDSLAVRLPQVTDWLGPITEIVPTTPQARAWA